MENTHQIEGRYECVNSLIVKGIQLILMVLPVVLTFNMAPTLLRVLRVIASFIFGPNFSTKTKKKTGSTMHLSDISKSDRIKINLAAEITKRIGETGLNQRDVSKRIGLSRTKIVSMKQGQVDGISLEKMLTILEKLDERVAIVLGNDARETRVEYETDEERYLRLNGDSSIPQNYLSGFEINLADGFSVEISGDPEEWGRHQLPFGSLADDIVHRPENREVEKVLKAIVCAALKSGDPQGSWSKHLETFYLARSELKHGHELTPRMEGILRNADSVLKGFVRDIAIHQRELASFQKSRDQDEEVSLVTFGK